MFCNKTPPLRAGGKKTGKSRPIYHFGGFLLLIYNEKTKLDKILDADKNDEPIYKIDFDTPTEQLPEIGKVTNTADESKYKDSPQDLKDETSQD